MRKKRRILALCGVNAAMAMACAGSAYAQSYDARIEGAPNGLRDKLALISELMKGAREYPTGAALRRAARRDTDTFNDALRAAGYYEGAAAFNLIRPEDGGAKPQIIFEITPGEPFRVTEYEILYSDDGADRPTNLSQAEIKTRGAADGAALRAHQEAFLNYLWNNGYPTAEILTRRAIANYETHEASAIYVFNSGPKARFGPAQIEGATKVDADFLARMKTWEEGEEFERKKMSAYYDKLRDTGLFSKIEIAPGDTSPDGVTPIIVELEERKLRTIGAGVSYSTSEGPGGRLFFEHRNIFGHGENLRTELRGSQIEQAITAALSRPMPGIGGVAFATTAFTNETTDAYNARSFEVSGGLSKKWLENRLETRGAVKLETSNVRANGMEDRNYLLSTPLSVIWNSEDDLLNPSRGFKASWRVTPYTGSQTFTQSEITGRSRIHFGAKQRVTLAARAALGATFANGLTSLPLNKRYYAGGGGSVRGYGYQRAGPLDADGDPTGGRSFADGAVEARVKVMKNIQIAGFVDAGTVSTSSIPDFNDEVFVGYGGGVRYMTPIGPIRADVAFPLDKRDSDSAYQIYIALGQSF